MAKVNGPFSVMTWLLPKTFCSMKLLSVKPLLGVRPARPTTAPPMLKVTALHVIATLVTLEAAAPLPVPGVTTQVWVGPVGCEKTPLAPA